MFRCQISNLMIPSSPSTGRAMVFVPGSSVQLRSMSMQLHGALQALCKCYFLLWFNFLSTSSKILIIDRQSQI